MGVAGQKVRFPYQQVEARSYNLDADDILRLDDQVLEKYVPSRALAPFREEEYKPTASRRQFIRKQKWAAAEQEEREEELDAEKAARREEKRLKREAKKRKKARQKRREQE